MLQSFQSLCQNIRTKHNIRIDHLREPSPGNHGVNGCNVGQGYQIMVRLRNETNPATRSMEEIMGYCATRVGSQPLSRARQAVLQYLGYSARRVPGTPNKRRRSSRTRQRHFVLQKEISVPKTAIQVNISTEELQSRVINHFQDDDFLICAESTSYSFYITSSWMLHSPVMPLSTACSGRPSAIRRPCCITQPTTLRQSRGVLIPYLYPPAPASLGMAELPLLNPPNHVGILPNSRLSQHACSTKRCVSRVTDVAEDQTLSGD